jgi:hypothetical protein
LNKEIGEITKYDKKRFDAISDFFGCCIENVEAKTIKLTTIVAIEFVKK